MPAGDWLAGIFICRNHSNEDENDGFSDRRAGEVKHYATESEQSQTNANQLSNVQLQHEFDYIRAQRILDELLKEGLISLSEFDDITTRNRESFSPAYAQIMPSLR